MAALGFTTTRWFLFCDGRAGIVYDDRGLPIDPDPHLFADLDAALEIARDTAIRVDFVLFDYRWMFAGLRDEISDQVTGAMLETRLPEGRAPRATVTVRARSAVRPGPRAARAQVRPCG